MNYISLLTQEEKSILCDVVTGREFRKYFMENENSFSKIRKGFRAKSLTERQALQIAKTNVGTPFIAMWVNTKVDSWLKQIQENIEKLEEDGLTYDFALTTTMLDSIFVDHADLYLKLTGKDMDEDATTKLRERMEHVKADRARDAEAANRIRALEDENRHLSEQIEATQQSIHTMRAEYEQKVLGVEQEKAALTSLLTKAQEQISELQATPISAESGDVAVDLALLDDTNASALPSIGGNEIVSLCGVVSDYNGRKWLMRYADLSHNGHFHIFRKNEDASPYFANRDKLFYKDGPSNDYSYSIWNWSAIPNENDSTKDYIISRYNMELDAIEVITITDVSNLDELVHLIQDGIKCQAHSRRVMFSFYSSKGQYIGILCHSNEFSTINGKVTFAESCSVLPVYEFTNGDILHLDNGLSFYRSVFAGIPDKLYQVKSHLEIVRDIVLSSLSWTAYKARGATRAEYRTFKEFLRAIPVGDVMGRIETECRCSASAAKELLNQFLHVAWKYIDGSSLEDRIILSAISASADLQEKTKSLIRADWEAENMRLLAKAKSRLDSLGADLNAVTASLAEEQKALKKAKAEDERLSCAIAEKKKMAEDVEKAVAQKIQKARENAASFIADMAFVSGQQVMITASTPPAAVEASFEPVITPYHAFPALENLDDLEAHHSWADVMNTVALELGEAGVTDQYRSGLAAFLCAAYIEKQPIFLVGSNAIDIMQAFSAAVTGHQYGVLCCEGNYTQQVIEKIGGDGENIVIINNLLAGGWMNRLPEIISRKEIFYVATHPYAEDIQVEPKSLYGLMLPLFTDFFVNEKATGQYSGGYFAADFKPYSAPKRAHKRLKVLSKLALNPLVENQIDRVVATMHGIHPATTIDDEFLFAIFPIAYASLSISELTEAIADPQKGITLSASLKRDLQYVLGDV